MKVSYDNGILHVTLPEKINAENAADFEKELFAIEQLPYAKEIVFDANNLKYISSLGLRVIFKLTKEFDKTPTTVFNASSEVREILDETGITSWVKVYKKLRNVDLNSLTVLGTGMYGSVYRINDEQILKVFHDVYSELEMRNIIDNVRIAFTHDIPTIMPFEVVRTEKGFGVILELLTSQILSTLMHNNTKDFDKYVVKMVELAKTLANTEFEEGTLKNSKDIVTEYVDSAAEFLTPEEIVALKNYIDIVPRRNTGVHGDFHARNIMMMDDKPILIDMDAFSCGHPVFDVGGTYFIYKLCPHFSDDMAHKLFEIEGITLADFYFKMIRFTVDEADRCWEKFFDEYFKDYSAQEKIYLADAAKVYGLFKSTSFAIDRCKWLKNEPARLAMKLDAIRYFLKEMQAVNTGNLIKAFEVWK